MASLNFWKKAAGKTLTSLHTGPAIQRRRHFLTTVSLRTQIDLLIHLLLSEDANRKTLRKFGSSHWSKICRVTRCWVYNKPITPCENVQLIRQHFLVKFCRKRNNNNKNAQRSVTPRFLNTGAIIDTLRVWMKRQISHGTHISICFENRCPETMRQHVYS